MSRKDADGTMKLDKPWMRSVGSMLGAAAAEALFRSTDARAAHAVPMYDPGHPDCPDNVLVVIWHEYLLGPLWGRQHNDITILVSQHRDAKWLSAVGRRWGYDVVEGSSNRGGAAAVREILALSNKRLAMTPDGPTGPRRQLAQGPIWLASRQKRPLVCLGVGYDRPFRFNSWDRFALPRPGSRVRLMFGEPLWLPPRMNADEAEHARLFVQNYLEAVTVAAENWAASGDDALGGWPLGRLHPPEWTTREDVFAPTGRIELPAPLSADAPRERRSRAA
ncbi:MAG TPA: DUF374 domain-containing protein [Pirellulales bacterium]